MKLFKKPTKEYRGAPFWAWNCKIDKDKLEKQISCFAEMGFGGYHMHTRLGMATEYLSDEFMDHVAFCIEKGKEKDMYSYLYDEDRWPSGYAGGLVTKEPRFRQRILCITGCAENLPKLEMDTEKAFVEGLPYLICCYDVEFDREGYLKNYKKIDVSDVAEHKKYYAYSATEELTGRYNFQTYVDIMQPEAIRRFIEITHKRYYDCFGEEYGKNIPSIFSDEPRHVPMEQMSESNPDGTAVYCWTYGFAKSFQEQYGYDLIEVLPYLVWDTAEKDYCYVRYHFFNHVEKLFEEAFFKQISEVTGKQKLAFTGHLMGEHMLLEQLSRTGDAMRQYPYFDIPGIDVLFDRVEVSTAKQTQSIVRQFGKRGMMSELYGVTGWDFDFKCLKAQGDWQAALGVTLRIPHLSLMSMRGMAKRDYPASFNYQSPWYKEFKCVEDYFARLNTILTRGKAVVNVAVLHPLETTMLHYSTKEKSSAYLEQQEMNFQNITSWLLYSAIDFDFLNEALLPEQVISYDRKLQVGKMEYTAVVIPPVDTIRETSLEILESFTAHGGKVIFTGKCPKYVDGKKSDKARKLYNASAYSGLDKTELIELLEEERTVSLRNSDGTNTNDLIYQLKKDESCLWLFVAHARKMSKTSYERSLLTAKDIIVTIEGEYNVLVYDAVSGKVEGADYTIGGGKTTINYSLYANDSLLLQLTKEKVPSFINKKQWMKKGELILWDKVSYKRSEPNVVLFDVGRYSCDGKNYSDKEYVLEMNNKIADKLGITYCDAQPYVRMDEKENNVYICFTFESEEDMEGVSLALERAEECKVFLNGVDVEQKITGYYVDEDIKTIALPQVNKGFNKIDIIIPFSATKNLEPCYLLGEFNVTLTGCIAKIHKASGKIGFGTITGQGMPFYGGNVTYCTEVDTPECTARITISDFGAHCVRVFVDDEDAGLIAFAPFAIERKLSEGTHKLTFLCYGNRNNTFGPVHNKRLRDGDYYIEPTVWEKNCEFWRPSYFLQETGILSSPIIEFLF